MAQKAGHDHREWGSQMERLATEYLLSRGYVVRETNWVRTKGHEELDIVAQQHHTIVFVEVKARSDVDAWPEDAVTPPKVKRIVRAAQTYMSTLGTRDAGEADYLYRFDIITLVGDPTSYRLEHMEDAFYPPLF